MTPGEMTMNLPAKAFLQAFAITRANLAATCAVLRAENYHLNDTEELLARLQEDADSIVQPGELPDWELAREIMRGTLLECAKFLTKGK